MKNNANKVTLVLFVPRLQSGPFRSLVCQRTQAAVLGLTVEATGGNSPQPLPWLAARCWCCWWGLIRIDVVSETVEQLNMRVFVCMLMRLLLSLPYVRTNLLQVWTLSPDASCGTLSWALFKTKELWSLPRTGNPPGVGVLPSALMLAFIRAKILIPTLCLQYGGMRSALYPSSNYG